MLLSVHSQYASSNQRLVQRRPEHGPVTCPVAKPLLALAPPRAPVSGIDTLRSGSLGSVFTRRIFEQRLETQSIKTMVAVWLAKVPPSTAGAWPA